MTSQIKAALRHSPCTYIRSNGVDLFRENSILLNEAGPRVESSRSSLRLLCYFLQK